MHLGSPINTQQVHAGANKAITKVILHRSVKAIVYLKGKGSNILELELQHS
jgi:hypothetical protein